MKIQLALAASIACALAACNGTGGPSGPPTNSVGTDPAPSSSDPTPSGSEPAGGGAEPTISGTDPGPGGTSTIPQMCAAVCGRLAAACSGAEDPAQCTTQCTTDVSTPGPCQSVFMDFVRCLMTAPISCVNNSLSAPECNPQILALSQCMGTATPTGGTGAGGAAGSSPGTAAFAP
jgi:hypothetical protein